VLAFTSPALSATAFALPLRFVDSEAKNIDCIFNIKCKVAAHDRSESIALPAGVSGKAYLHSRTFKGGLHSTAAGKTAYQYRVNLRQASSMSEAPCITGVILTFGPVTQLPYSGLGNLDDVHVIKSDNPDAIGLFAVEKTGNSIALTFRRPVCAAIPGNGQGAESRFFGMTSNRPPKTMLVNIVLPDGRLSALKSRVPDL
jgi:hypothetical protein